ncbi:hypothetical protein JAAARDRAFT_55600 [Jaapia argillacea MUCL 33604]|uniref:NmrA-like domain-containing protein n=1 Tax=Jaapia argillacea MUCL 33604 TaxID=933084 RepID=A0A067QE44_9AGAM|nr:hypothetical protein JAAARDRAFT_55600 [Jaapia argillacea MUCL 33604]
MAEPIVSPRTVLVVGATGKQGSAVISFLSQSQSDFRILALTRKASSPAAQSLIRDSVSPVEGDLDKPDTIRKIFVDASSTGGIWGIFVILAFPGLGVNADAEESQGILLVNLAVEFQVKTFIFSSVERGGEAFDDHLTLDRAAKVKIENHLRSSDNLSWTILRPAFFMENFDGAIGKVTTTVLQQGLKADTKLQLIAVEDIAHVACAIFENPEPYDHKIIVVVGDILTTAEQDQSYLRATGRHLPSVPSFLGKALLATNSHTKALISDMERIHGDRSIMEEGYQELLTTVRSIYPHMQTFEEWARNRGRKDDRGQRWNNVSIIDLILGRR